MIPFIVHSSSSHFLRRSIGRRCKSSILSMQSSARRIGAGIRSITIPDTCDLLLDLRAIEILVPVGHGRWTREIHPAWPGLQANRIVWARSGRVRWRRFIWYRRIHRIGYWRRSRRIGLGGGRFGRAVEWYTGWDGERLRAGTGIARSGVFRRFKRIRVRCYTALLRRGILGWVEWVGHCASEGGKMTTRNSSRRQLDRRHLAAQGLGIICRTEHYPLHCRLPFPTSVQVERARNRSRKIRWEDKQVNNRPVVQQEVPSSRHAPSAPLVTHGP